MSYMLSVICRICVMCIEQQLEQKKLNELMTDGVTLPEVHAHPVVSPVASSQEVDSNNNIITTRDVEIIDDDT